MVENNKKHPLARRVFDIAFSVLGLVIAAPVLFLAVSVVWVETGWPLIYRQKRVGLTGKPFTIYKIRTMTNARGKDGQLLPETQRMTRFGAFLRAHAVDEFPQLWNVIKGDMSIFGPRPLLEGMGAEVPGFDQRNQIKPGLMGLADVYKRQHHEIPLDERLKNDLKYIEGRPKWGHVLDMLVFFRAAKIGLLGRNEHLPALPLRRAPKRDLRRAV